MVTRPTNTHLSKLVPTRVVNGYGPLEVDRSNGGIRAGDGRPLSIGGRTFATGLGAHAASDVSFALAGRYAHFTAQVGVDDEVGAAGSVVFEVWVDGVLKQRTARLTGKNGALPVSVSVWGAKTLRLIVTAAGDGKAHDHADWADAKLWVAS